MSRHDMCDNILAAVILVAAGLTCILALIAALILLTMAVTLANGRLALGALGCALIFCVAWRFLAGFWAGWNDGDDTL